MVEILLIKLLMTGTGAYAGFHIFQASQTARKHGFQPNDTQTTPQKIDTEASLTVTNDISNSAQAMQLSPKESALAAVDKPDSRHIENRLNFDLALSSAAVAITSLALILNMPWLGMLSIPASIWAAQPAFKPAYESLKRGRPNMAVLDIIYFIGTAAAGFYFASALGFFVFSLSRKLLYHTENHSKESLLGVFTVKTQSVWLVQSDLEIEIPIEQLKVGDVLAVHAGEVIPVDGTIVDGIGLVDQHILTGEAQPVEKTVNDTVYASTLLLSGKLQIAVEKAGSETTAAQIGEILAQTNDFKSMIQSHGQQMADRSVSPILGISTVAGVMMGPASVLTSLNACFGLYIRVLAPISVLTYLTLASRQGILIKDGRSLELLKYVDTVVFDKTGTLTLDRLHVNRIFLTGTGSYNDTELLIYAAAAEHRQTHPIAQAIIQAAADRGLELPALEHVEYEISNGICAKLWDDPIGRIREVRVGSLRFMEANHIAIADSVRNTQQQGQADGYTYVYIAIDGQLNGIFELEATLRPEAKTVIAELKQRGKQIYIISGDHEQPTRRLAKELGVDHYFAETLPEDKATLVQQLQDEGRSTCFIGDGINDSMALKTTHVSISLSGASALATDTAQIVLMDQSLNKLVPLFDLSNDFDRNLQFNTIATIIPGVLIISGVFFLNLSIVGSVLLNQIGFWSGMANSTIPLLQNDTDNSHTQAHQQEHVHGRITKETSS